MKNLFFLLVHRITCINCFKKEKSDRFASYKHDRKKKRNPNKKRRKRRKEEKKECFFVCLFSVELFFACSPNNQLGRRSEHGFHGATKTKKETDGKTKKAEGKEGKNGGKQFFFVLFNLVKNCCSVFFVKRKNSFFCFGSVCFCFLSKVI